MQVWLLSGAQGILGSFWHADTSFLLRIALRIDIAFSQSRSQTQASQMGTLLHGI